MTTPAGTWRGVWAGGLVAVATVIAGVLATDSVGLPLRDPAESLVAKNPSGAPQVMGSHPQ